MYCKHCGKEIADDSTFCKHCGGKQELVNTSNASTIESANIKEKEKASKSFLSNKIGWIIGYGIYVIINVLLLISGYDSPIANEFFWPFGETNLMYHEPFNPANYDITEFIVYVFLIPLLVLGWLWYKAKQKDKSKA